jgi:hypothetical protein
LPAGFYGTSLVRVNPDTSVTVVTGTGPSGQGHQTTWAQIVSDRLGLPVGKIRVIHGDTEESPMGAGTFGSRSLAVDGAATFNAAERVAEKARHIAAHLLEASADDIELDEDGGHVVGSPESSVPWNDIAAAAYLPHQLGTSELEGGLESHVIFDPPNATWPFGSHPAMVRLTPRPGREDLRYFTVDDAACDQPDDRRWTGPWRCRRNRPGYVRGSDTTPTAHVDGLVARLSDPYGLRCPFFELNRRSHRLLQRPWRQGLGEAGTIGRHRRSSTRWWTL